MTASVSDILLGLYQHHLMAFVERSYYELRPGAPFHYGHHIRAICYQLERVMRGEITRLLILMPPRHLKSHCASIAFPVWMLGRDPSLRIITMSYGASLARTFSRDARRLMEAEWVRATFPDLRIDPRNASVDELSTTRFGGRIATSVGGAVTGKGGDILIIDDPIKAGDVTSEVKRQENWDWYAGTVKSRLDNPKTGAIIMVAQRLHIDDLPGRLIESGKWEVLELPAIETIHREIPLSARMAWTRTPGDVLLPDHIGLEELEQHRSDVGSFIFNAQYQQSPAAAGGNIIRPEWLRTYSGTRRRQDYEAVVQSWDTASVPGESNDYSVCTTWGLIGNHIDLLDVHRAQYQYPELRVIAHKLRRRWKPNLVVIETMDVGRSLIHDLERIEYGGVRGASPKSNKIDRMVVQSAKIEEGQVRLPESAPWKEAFLKEVVGFPNAKYDDQADSMSQALWAIDLKKHELRHCSRYKGA